MSHASTLPQAQDAGAAPVIRRIGFNDVRDALAEGWSDFLAIPTQLVFLALIYPVIGFVAARMASDETLLPLLFPMLAGFALMGPLLAVGIYELSRRREAGLPVSWLNAFDVLRSPAILSIAWLGAMLLGFFVVWLIVAKLIYVATVGNVPLDSVVGLVEHIQTSPAALHLVLIGNAVGFLFAAAVLTLTVVSFPMMLDRNVGPGTAVGVSVKAVLANPAAMALWGLVVAVLLAVGVLTFFVGLAVALPLLGHATWRLYRKVVA